MASKALEEYLETIENLPAEINSDLTNLLEKDTEFEELRRGLLKKRTNLLKHKSKNLDKAAQETMLKKCIKDQTKAKSIIESKINSTHQTALALEKHIQRLDQVLASLSGETIELQESITPLRNTTPLLAEEAVYCYCQQVSFGDMIACDNANCEKEWFHYACVGLFAPPKGKWFCNECLAKKRESNDAE